MKNLTALQNELKAPKSRFNSFGKYNYRSLEDILTGAKPLLDKYGLQLTVSDEIVAVGDRVYVKATATLTDGQEVITVSALARESEEKKGMDASQITGTASSYARKYCLNGLFLIDDTQDADTDAYHNITASETIGKDRAKALESLLSGKGVDVAIIYKEYKVQKLAELTEEQHAQIVRRLAKTR